MKYAAISKRNAKRPKYGGGKKDRIKPGDEFLGGYRFSKDFGVDRGPALKPLRQGEDYGMDPLGDGTFKLVPSGRIAKSWEEAKKMIADSKRNPSERVSTGVSEAYATKKGSGTIQSPKKRGPYSVQFMARGGEAVTKNIARLPAARKWLRSKLGVLRKANPVKPPDAFLEAVLRYRSQGDVDWGFHMNSSKADRDALDRYLVAVGHPLAMEPGTQERRWKSFVKSYRGEAEPTIPEGRKKVMRGSNPSGEQRSADTLFEEFHGKSPTRTVEVRTSVKVREHLAQLGVLVSLKVLLLTGEKIELTFPAEGRDAVTLASSPDGRQLYFEGGNQHIDLGDLKMASSKWERDSMVLGVLFQVTYQTTKGFDKFQLTDYYHDLGEETKIQPLLIYDRLSKLLTVSGGQYEVKPEGIVN